MEPASEGLDAIQRKGRLAMESLTTIANRYGTDKGTEGPTSGWSGHNYTDIYEAYLSRFRGERINLLEIGIGVTGERWYSYMMTGRNESGGASLKMWQDYFPHANIFGIDVNPASHLDRNRIRTFVVDQGDVGELAQFVAAVDNIEFDVVIDDGSHRPDHQQVALGFLFRHLRSGGLYFIEDLLDNGRDDRVVAHSGPNEVYVDTALSTRNVLRKLQAEGELAVPNRIHEPDYILQHLHSIAFHSPEPVISWVTGSVRPFQLVRKVRHYRPSSESLCVLHKR